jgi:hypothetical protein
VSEEELFPPEQSGGVGVFNESWAGPRAFDLIGMRLEALQFHVAVSEPADRARGARHSGFVHEVVSDVLGANLMDFSFLDI